MSLSEQFASFSLNQMKEIFDLNAVSEEELKQHCDISNRPGKTNHRTPQDVWSFHFS